MDAFGQLRCCASVLLGQQPRIRASAFERLEGVNCVIITEHVESVEGEDMLVNSDGGQCW